MKGGAYSESPKDVIDMIVISLNVRQFRGTHKKLSPKRCFAKFKSMQQLKKKHVQGLSTKAIISLLKLVLLSL